MSDIRLVSAAMRVMFTSATAATQYPTGVSLGIKGNADAAAGDVFGAADTTSATNTASPFHGKTSRVAIIHRIIVMTPGATSPSITLQDHGGQKALTPAIDTSVTGVVGNSLDFAEGLCVRGGFRVVTAGATAPVCAIVYEIVGP